LAQALATACLFFSNHPMGDEGDDGSRGRGRRRRRREGSGETETPLRSHRRRRRRRQETGDESRATTPVDVRLSRTTGVTAAGAWAARLEIADLLESGANPEEIIRAIRAGEEEGRPLGLFSEPAHEREPARIEAPEPANEFGEDEPFQAPPGDFAPPEIEDWELVAAEQRSILDSLKKGKDHVPPWARPAHPEKNCDACPRFLSSPGSSSFFQNHLSAVGHTPPCAAFPVVHLVSITFRMSTGQSAQLLGSKSGLRGRNAHGHLTRELLCEKLL